MTDLFTHAESARLRDQGMAREFPVGIPEECCLLFERLALEIAKKRTRYSADAILHRMRWYYQIECDRGDYKINDHFSSKLARWFIGRHPDLDGFFELRPLRS